MMKITYLLALVTLFKSVVEGRLRFEVGPGQEECFLFDCQSGDTIKIAAFISGGHQQHIKLRVLDPNGKEFHEGGYNTQLTHGFVVGPAGPHQACFSNIQVVPLPFTTNSKYVEVTIEKNPLDKPALDNAPLPHILTEISKHFDKVNELQKYLQTREVRARDLAEYTNTRVYMYSILECVILLIISVGNVFFLRRYFEAKR